MGRSAAGLLDASLPDSELRQIEAILASYRLQGLEFDALRTDRRVRERWHQVSKRGGSLYTTKGLGGRLQECE
jgi:hypothetical protein